MTGALRKQLSLIVLALLLAGCSSSGTLRPFSSDGCSLFPDRAPCGDADWCACCLAHDQAYWLGGTREQRRIADRALRDCVAEQTGSRTLAHTMYVGVRLGGVPWLPTGFRWGYGWDGLRPYRPLSEAEQALAEGIDATPPGVCPSRDTTSP